uniref:Neprilysin n=1 Tax=Hadrurus spadix TaxID=141984 RepID=A0A1W7RA38_9SCOR
MQCTCFYTCCKAIWRQMTRLGQKYRKRSKRLASSCFVVFVLLVVLQEVNCETCVTEECVYAANDLLTHMNRSVDPCQDFYSFACGKWESSDPHISSMTTRLTEMTRTINLRMKNLLETPSRPSDPRHWLKAKRFYKACMDSDTREKYDNVYFVEVINRLGGWPILKNDCWNEDTFEWILSWKRMLEMGYNRNILVTVSVASDMKNTSRKMIYLDIPMFGMKKEYFSHSKYLEAYFHFILKMITSLDPQIDLEFLMNEMERALEIERNLAQMACTTTNRRNPAETYNLISIEDLMNKLPEVNWLKLINIFLSDYKLIETDKVVMKEPEFLAHFSKYMKTLECYRRRDLANYMFYRLAISSAIDMDKAFRWYYFDYKSTLLGVDIHPALWSICIRATTTAFSISASSVYIRRHFRNETRKAVSDMVGRIQGRLISILRHVKWMDEKTRINAIRKARHLNTVIGYSDDLLDDRLLNAYYDNVPVGHFHYRNTQKIRALQYGHMMQGYGRPVNKRNMVGHTGLLRANAYYSPSLNTMNIPVGILQRVMFHEKNPQYMNFGRLGAIVGHELTHAFDDKGARYDKDGNWNMWWANDTYKKFIKSADCLIKQYNKFFIKELNIPLNGTRTLGENIADNCGVRESYLAYRRWAMDHMISEPTLPGMNYTGLVQRIFSESPSKTRAL